MVPLEHVTFWILCALVQISSAQVDGGLSEWSEWTMWSCPVTCGQSLTNVTRTRDCTNPVPKNGGLDCEGKRVEIEPRTCNANISCPIDGGFSSWSPWNMAPCSVTCGVNATRFSTRRRNCNSPTPQDGGTNCTGPHEENVTRTCGLGNCQVDGGFSSWSPWNMAPCSVTCGVNATRFSTRRRNCNSPTPQDGGTNCTGPHEENVTRNCGLGNCKVDGGFSSWSPWNMAPCSVTCGVNATRFSTRRRNCNSPTPQDGGTNCTGPHEENVTRTCGLGNCQVDGGFSSWSPWNMAPCSVTCGVNATRFSTRRRNCNSPTPQDGGTNCTGPHEENVTRNCGLGNCKVDGGFSSWSPWNMAPCSVTCGVNATRFSTRRRNCNSPTPQDGGTNCTGPHEENVTRTCGLGNCQVDGGFSSWSPWNMAPCSVTCGVNATRFSTRRRNCNSPTPQDGGTNCTGPHEENVTRNCGLGNCQVDGGFSSWSPWNMAPCSVTCGVNATRFSTRRRNCNSPTPQDGGTNCTGPHEENVTRTCGHGNCKVDGGLSSWTEWSSPACTESCGLAATSVVGRNRYCNNPEPEGGGQDCNGPRNESQLRGCVLPACPKPPVDARIMAGVVIGVGLVLIFIAVAMTCNFFLHKERSPPGPACEDNFRRSEFHEYNRMKTGFLDNKHTLSYI
ncbi:coadhesin-like isoform X2 [Haliotis rufescens]|uniref:coadhesin-like isoform X2 n=1 Tax=Haliotis rufescens TaxID=6454 RepID=UPI00201EC3F4|nr:coadhesin-like isoform X2 [Haliotis rufescens]